MTLTLTLLPLLNTSLRVSPLPHLRTLKRFVNFSFGVGNIWRYYLHIMRAPPVEQKFAWLSFVGRTLRDEAYLCQSRLCSIFWAALIGAACARGGPESILGFVVDKVALGEIFSKSISFPLSVSFHHCSVFILHLLVALSRKTNGRSLVTFQKSVVFRKWGIVG